MILYHPQEYRINSKRSNTKSATQFTTKCSNWLKDSVQSGGICLFLVYTVITEWVYKTFMKPLNLYPEKIQFWTFWTSSVNQRWGAFSLSGELYPSLLSSLLRYSTTDLYIILNKLHISERLRNAESIFCH